MENQRIYPTNLKHYSIRGEKVAIVRFVGDLGPECRGIQRSDCKMHASDHSAAPQKESTVIVHPSKWSHSLATLDYASCGLETRILGERSTL